MPRMPHRFGFYGICNRDPDKGSSADRLVSCGYWDGCIKSHRFDTKTLRLQAVSSGGHVGDITCLQVGSDLTTMVTGGSDSTCRVWCVDQPARARAMSEADATPGGHVHAGYTGGGVYTAGAEEELRKTLDFEFGMDHFGGDVVDEGQSLMCVHVLWGHEAPITTLTLSSDLDIIVSGAADGRVCMHRTSSGAHVRDIAYEPAHGPVSLLMLSTSGYIIVHYHSTKLIRTYSLNGTLLMTKFARQKLMAGVVTANGDMAVVGGESGDLDVYMIHNLDLVKTRPVQTSNSKNSASTVASGSGSPKEKKERDIVTTLAFSNDHQYLFVGTHSGRVWICTDPRIRLEMLDVAINKTFSGMI